MLCGFCICVYRLCVYVVEYVCVRVGDVYKLNDCWMSVYGGVFVGLCRFVNIGGVGNMFVMWEGRVGS